MIHIRRSVIRDPHSAFHKGQPAARHHYIYTYEFGFEIRITHLTIYRSHLLQDARMSVRDKMCFIPLHIQDSNGYTLISGRCTQSNLYVYEYESECV